ncbi:MAG: multicopper oxidase domain-containing protein [Bacteroidetes bacterium]|nr:multicopper oxidase domain-containing protein [Bacteroidota bacterium]
MQKLLLVFILLIAFSVKTKSQSYNNLWIPDTITGTTFNLTVKDTFKQIITPGNQTITGGINNNFWGPTLFFNKGDTVHMKVKNKLNDSTTIHWHGMHLPAVMDGGPHQVIPPGTLWQPYWKVANNAGTYWYHPHLHQMTVDHLTKGIGGFIIVRDPIESALALPRKYGIDDIPLVLTSRRYDASNQFVTLNTSYGDYMLTNGTPSAQISLPKQYVRLRILNAEIERGYDLGFSDNRTFYIIGTDGGLVNTPVAVTRVKLLVGERVEIMVNLGNDVVGSSIDLKAYNSGQTFGFPGGEPATSGQFGSLLNNIDFPVLHINVIATTANPITLLPATLANNVYWTASNATVTRTINITNGNPGPNPIPFNFDNTSFVLNTINKTVNLNDIEKWTVVNNNVFGHTFHIHDVEFKITDRNGSTSAVGTHESGWKDVMYVPKGESVSFVAKFDDFADAIHPFMYHCHFSNHEDSGMMGQFVVTNPAGFNELKKEVVDFSIFPNPAEDKLFIQLRNVNTEVYYVTIVNINGKAVMMLPQPEIAKGIDVSALSRGVYFVQLMDKKTKTITTQKFVKQ